MLWPPTRDTALSQLATFLPLAGRHYRNGRNEDLGPGGHQQVSGLSPYLRHRLLLDEEVLAAVFTRHGLHDGAKFIDEVFWRSYFKGWLEHHPGVWASYADDCAELRNTIKHDAALRRAYTDAIFARTGIAPFDAWAAELRATGYLHNHARMWFASIWIFTLGLPWQLGAQWFHYHLLDGDAASNTLSWRWVAGLHTKGKTYLARADNIRRYTAQRFSNHSGPDSYDGLERLASSAPALTEDPAVTKLQTPIWPGYTESTTGGRTGLLLHDEDMSILAPMKPDAVAMLAPQRTGRGRAARQVSRFGLGAAKSTLARADETLNLQIPTQLLRSPEAAIRWMQSARLDKLLVPYVPQGPSHRRVNTLLDQAAELGIETHLFMRSVDQMAWPHAKQGFFALRKRIPAILERLEIAPPHQAELLPF